LGGARAAGPRVLRPACCLVVLNQDRGGGGLNHLGGRVLRPHGHGHRPRRHVAVLHGLPDGPLIAGHSLLLVSGRPCPGHTACTSSTAPSSRPPPPPCRIPRTWRSASRTRAGPPA